MNLTWGDVLFFKMWLERQCSNPDDVILLILSNQVYKFEKLRNYVVEFYENMKP